MNPTDIIDRDSLRDDIPEFRPGDTVKVHVRVVEGSRERVQVFEGAVIRRQGTGVRETFTVRKVSFGVGVERTFPLHSPVIAKTEVVSLGDVRRGEALLLAGTARQGREDQGEAAALAADLSSGPSGGLAETSGPPGRTSGPVGNRGFARSTVRPVDGSPGRRFARSTVRPDGRRRRSSARTGPGSVYSRKAVTAQPAPRACRALIGCARLEGARRSSYRERLCS